MSKASGDSSSRRIVIVDDDVAFAEEISGFLSGYGFSVVHVHDAPAARVVKADKSIDLFILNLVLPGTSGKVLCRELSETSKAGIFIVSQLDADDERIALLGLGADDYIVKPFNHMELLARIRAYFRRVRGRNVAYRVDRFGDWVFEAGERQLKNTDGRIVSLTPSETRVLRHFAANPDIVMDREEILAISRMRQHSGGSDRSVDNLIKRLRRKIEPDPAHPRFLETVWGAGYVFRPD